MNDLRAVAAAAQSIASDIREIRAGKGLGSTKGPRRNNPPEAEPEPVPVARTSPVKVFVSWAHSDEDWTPDQANDWERRVIAFTTILRSYGIDADVDLYHGAESAVDWTRFGQAGVLGADYVIILNSKGWSERWSGANSPTLGAGAVVEADTLKGQLQEDQSKFQRRTLLVRLPGPGRVKIPTDLNRLNRFTVDTDDLESFDALLRTLTGQPTYVAPELGVVPVLPPAVTEGINMRKRPKTSRSFSAYEALRDEVEKIEEESENHPNQRSQRRLATLLGLLDAL